MCTATQTLVLVGRQDRRPTPVPEPYRSVVGAFEGTDFGIPPG